MHLSVERIASPLGQLTIVVSAGALVALEFEENEERLRGHLLRRFGPLTSSEPPSKSALTSAIEAYFAGDLAALDSIPVDVAGTAFERQVYAELRRIPRGTTVTYAELARRTGRALAVRAAGAANAKNPISIVVPCHRVIGADGSLTGYAGGLERKAWLLRHEGASFSLAARRGLDLQAPESPGSGA